MFKNKVNSERFIMTLPLIEAFCGGSDGKESVCNAGDPGSITGLGRSPGEGNGYPLQYSCLGNPMDRGAWGLQSLGSQRVGHIEWLTNTSLSFELDPGW